MFEQIIEQIKNKEYDGAISELKPFCQNEDAKVKSRANYLLGYINTCWDYKDKKKREAERHLYFNLNSEYPHPFAYILYADVLEDKNIAINYLYSIKLPLISTGHMFLSCSLSASAMR